jgi:iron complex outermembrane recepter protein
VAPKQMLWGAVSRAVRTPSRVDEDEVEAAPPRLTLIEGSPDFTSETVVAYELGYRAELGSQTSVSLSTYYNEYNDIRSTSITPRTVVPFYFANNLAGETHGFELSGTYQALPWWQLRASYDLLKENIGVKPGQFDLNDALNETADPESQYAVASNMEVLKNVALNARLRWVDSLEINNGSTIGTVPSYFELNARLGWRVSKNLELSLVGQNLLHAEHVEYGFPSPTREEIQRTFYGKAVWRY